MIEKIAHTLTRKPKLVALIAVLMLIPSLIGYAATRINYDILSYLPQDLPCLPQILCPEEDPGKADKSKCNKPARQMPAAFGRIDFIPQCIR